MNPKKFLLLFFLIAIQTKINNCYPSLKRIARDYDYNNEEVAVDTTTQVPNLDSTSIIDTTKLSIEITTTAKIPLETTEALVVATDAQLVEETTTQEIVADQIETTLATEAVNVDILTTQVPSENDPVATTDNVITSTLKSVELTSTQNLETTEELKLQKVEKLNQKVAITTTVAPEELEIETTQVETNLVDDTTQNVEEIKVTVAVEKLPPKIDLKKPIQTENDNEQNNYDYVDGIEENDENNEMDESDNVEIEDEDDLNEEESEKKQEEENEEDEDKKSDEIEVNDDIIELDDDDDDSSEAVKVTEKNSFLKEDTKATESESTPKEALNIKNIKGDKKPIDRNLIIVPCIFAVIIVSMVGFFVFRRVQKNRNKSDSRKSSAGTSTANKPIYKEINQKEDNQQGEQEPL